MRKNLLKVVALFFVATMSVSAMAQTVALQEVKKDSAVYDSIERFTLQNDWIRSAVAENYTVADLGGSALVRGMVAKEGKLYFAYRGGVGTHSIIVVNGANGAYEKTITLSENAFVKEINAGTDSASFVSASTLPNNDIKLDSEGNFLVGPCITSGAQNFQIYKVDIETGACTEIINEIIAENPDTAIANKAVRFDAFGVYGDINGDAVIMAMNASAIDCWRWVIEDGEVQGLGEYVMLDPLFEGSTDVNPGSAPQIMPISETMFYVDGNGTFPTLYQYEEGYGTRIDCFYNEEGEALPILGSMNQGHNGIKDFIIEYANGATEYFMLCAATNTAKAPASSFALIKYADETLSFADAELIYQFPEAGFGANSNAYRTAPVFADVRSEAGENGEAYVDIYVYVGENGMGKYTLTAEAPEYVQPDAVENVTISKVYTNGGLVVADGEIEIFTVTGQNVTSQNGKLAQGAYIVRAANGATKVFVK